ncbi:SRPBCC domain-containing protein [Sphingopyxis indica]|uniref:SRPBCC domain-containing protein n=1 Tax=Sphingopyxis indica TaxID=436663 RepID=UPI002938D590|nr:SRPBCC domain-containing protein [Sphingopyxis indica]
MVEAISFESNDPDFAGTMTLTMTLRPVTGGTKVSFLAENVPPCIKLEDHREGMESSLKNLANLLK